MTEGRRVAALTYGYALVVSGILAYFLFRMPIQVTDSFHNILVLDPPFLDLMREGYFRPGLWFGLKAVYDLSGGEYFWWYRGTQAVQVLLVVLLFVRLIDVRTRAAAAAAPLAVAALIGTHLFAGTVREAFPVNTFLTIVVCLAVAINISFSRYRWWNDVLAVLTFVVAAATLETGLLLLVVFVGGWLLGLPGVSRRGVVVLLVLLATYLWIRFGLLDVGTPTLAMREAGYGFERLGGGDLTKMFGANPIGFYVYNVVSSISSVLLAEPRDGLWRLTRSVVVDGRPDFRLVTACISAVLSTGLIAVYGWRRRRAWIARELTRDDCIVLLFVAVLLANSAISYAYTKDVILSPAGFLFAAALFVAMRDLIDRNAGRRLREMLPAAAVILILSTTWSIRAVGLHAALVETAASMREEWAYIDDYLRVDEQPMSPRIAALRSRLRHDALVRHPAKATLRDEWARFFEVE
jgi:hypothetical protein